MEETKEESKPLDKQIAEDEQNLQITEGDLCIAHFQGVCEYIPEAIQSSEDHNHNYILVEECLKLQNQLKLADIRIEENTTQINSLSQLKIELDSQNRILGENNEILAKQIKDKDEELAELNNKYLQSQYQNREIATKFTNISDLFAAKNQEYSLLMTNFQALDRVKEDLIMQIQRLTSQNTILDQMNQTYISEKNLMRENIHSLNFKGIEQGTEILEIKQNELVIRNEAETRFLHIKREFEGLCRKLADYENRIQIDENMIAQLEKEKFGLEGDIVKGNKEKKDILEDLSTKSSNLIDLNDQIDKIKVEYELKVSIIQQEAKSTINLEIDEKTKYKEQFDKISQELEKNKDKLKLVNYKLNDFEQRDLEMKEQIMKRYSVSVLGDDNLSNIWEKEKITLDKCNELYILYFDEKKRASHLDSQLKKVLGHLEKEAPRISQQNKNYEDSITAYKILMDKHTALFQHRKKLEAANGQLELALKRETEERVKITRELEIQSSQVRYLTETNSQLQLKLINEQPNNNPKTNISNKEYLFGNVDELISKNVEIINKLENITKQTDEQIEMNNLKAQEKIDDYKNKYDNAALQIQIITEKLNRYVEISDIILEEAKNSNKEIYKTIKDEFITKLREYIAGNPEQIEKEVTEREAKIQALSEQINKLTYTIQILEVKIKTQHEEMNKSDEELIGRLQRIQFLEAKVEFGERNEHSFRQQIEDIKRQDSIEKGMAITKLIRDYELQFHVLKMEKDNLEKTKNELTAYNTIHQENEARLIGHNKELQEQMEQLINTITETKKELIIENANQNEMLREKIDKNLRAEREIEELKSNLEGGEIKNREELTKLSVQVSNYKTINQAYKNKISSLTKTLLELEESIGKLDKERKITIQVLTRDGKTDPEKQTTPEQIENQIINITQIMSHSMEQIDGEDLECILEKQKLLNRDIEDSKKEIEELKSVIIKQQNDYNDIISANEALIIQLQKSFYTFNEQSNSDILHIRQELEETKIRMEEKIESLEAEKGEMEEQMKKNMGKIDELNREIMDINQIVEKKDIRISRQDSEFQEIKTTLITEQVKHNAEMETKSKLISELELKIMDANEKLIEIDQLKFKISELNAEIHHENESWDVQKVAFNSQIFEEKNRLEMVQEENRLLHEQLTQHYKLSKGLTEVEVGEKDDEVQIGEFQNIADEERKTSVGLNNLINTLRSDNQSLECNLERVRKDFIELQAKYEQVIKDYNQLRTKELIFDASNDKSLVFQKEIEDKDSRIAALLLESQTQGTELEKTTKQRNILGKKMDECKKELNKVNFELNYKIEALEYQIKVNKEEQKSSTVHKVALSQEEEKKNRLKLLDAAKKAKRILGLKGEREKKLVLELEELNKRIKQYEKTIQEFKDKKGEGEEEEANLEIPPQKRKKLE